MPRDNTAVSAPSVRAEPSLSGEAPRAAPRLASNVRPAVRANGASELRAGERLSVLSTSGAASHGSGPLLRRAVMVALVGLALVGAASLLRGFVGL